VKEEKVKEKRGAHTNGCYAEGSTQTPSLNQQGRTGDQKQWQ